MVWEVELIINTPYNLDDFGLSLESLPDFSAKAWQKKKKKKQDLEQISHEMMGMAHGFVVGESELENISGMFVAEIWIGTAEGPT